MTTPPPFYTTMRQGLSVGEVAKVLNLRDETIKTAIRNGGLPAYRLTEGRGWYWVKPEDVEVYAARCGLRVNWDALPKIPV